jgi:hypothetical protein
LVGEELSNDEGNWDGGSWWQSRLEVENVVVGDLAERTFVATDVKCKFRESLISLGSTMSTPSKRVYQCWSFGSSMEVLFSLVSRKLYDHRGSRLICVGKCQIWLYATCLWHNSEHVCRC